MATISSQRHTPFIAAILANLEDDHPKLVYSDFLDETGESDLAFAYRWAVAKGKRPEPPCTDHPEWYWHFDGRWCRKGTPSGSVLPATIEQPMSQGRLEHTRHDSYEEAMQALAAGLAELRRTLEIEGRESDQ